MNRVSRNVLTLVAVSLTLAACGLVRGPARAAEKKAAKPKLAVLIVFDQLRGDYLEKWQGLFGAGGFKRLQTEGARFTNWHYPYSDTLAAAGPAALGTGTSPYKNRSHANGWDGRLSAQEIT